MFMMEEQSLSYSWDHPKKTGLSNNLNDMVMNNSFI